MSNIPPPSPPPVPDEYNPLFEVANDNGPFLRLGSQFSCNKARWIGLAFASPTALYLLKKSKNSNSHGGGLVGMLLAAALTADDQLETCTAADLPGPIRAQLDPKGKLAKKSVVIVPLSTVSFVKAGGFNNALKLTAGADNFNIATSLFKLFATPRKLTSLGWTLNTQLTPIAAPVHDTRSPEERAQPAQKPLWLRILLIAGAVAVIAAIIALRIAAGH
jgi:hypothetical protein